MSSNGAVHCGRCGDFECRLGDDCGGADCSVCFGFRCEGCGAGITPPDDRPPPTPIPSAGLTREPATVGAGRAILTVAVVFTALVLAGPPAIGIIAKVAWRLFQFGWELIP